MGAGASTDYASVAAALDDGHSQVNIERHLTNSCATEIEAINKAFGTDEEPGALLLPESPVVALSSMPNRKLSTKSKH